MMFPFLCNPVFEYTSVCHLCHVFGLNIISFVGIVKTPVSCVNGRCIALSTYKLSLVYVANGGEQHYSPAVKKYYHHGEGKEIEKREEKLDRGGEQLEGEERGEEV